MAGPFSEYPISLNGVGYKIILDPLHPEQETPIGHHAEWAAQESTNQLAHRDVPKVMNKFGGGAGIVRSRGPEDDDRYAWVENMIMWTGEGMIPAGQQHSFLLSGISGGLPTLLNAARFIEIIEFLGHLWFIADTEFAVRIPNADPAQTPVYDPPIGGISASKGFRSGNNARCAELFKTSAGATALYVGTNNSGVGRVYECTATGTWAEGAAMSTGTTYTADKMRSVYWATYATGTGAQRLLLKTAAGEIRHCIDGSDPKAQASYVTPIQVGLPSDEIQALVAAPMHAYAVCNGGIKDFNESRVSELTPYWKTTSALTRQAASVMRGLPATIFNDYIVASRGWGSIDRYPVTNEGYQQRVTGECGPASVMQDGTPVSNLWITAEAESGDGALLLGGWNPDNHTSYVGRMYFKADGSVVQHWAEVVIPPISTVGYQITALHVGAPALSAGSALASPKLYLWIALAPESGGGQPIIRYVDLPIGSGPLSIRASGGTAMAHQSPARVYLSGDNGGDANALKAQRRVDLQHQGVDASNKIAVSQCADIDPAKLTHDGVFTVEDVWALIGTADATTQTSTTTTSATKTNIVPSVVPTGQMVYTRLDFTTASPFTAPPRAQEVRLRRAIRYEVFEVRFLNILLERGGGLPNGTAELPSTYTQRAVLAALQLTAPVTFVDQHGVSYQALVEGGITDDTVHIEGEDEPRDVMRVQISLVKQN